MSLIIHFLRHGETTASQTGGYCGTLDPDLTPESYQMAEDFADAYKSLPWAAVFSSALHLLILRERKHFWNSRPSEFLLLAIAADLGLVFFFSIHGLPGVVPIPPWSH
jgi:hypothetical protein